jgi:hypothetical protein
MLKRGKPHSTRPLARHQRCFNQEAAMALIDQLGGLLEQYNSGQALNRDQARSDYDRIASTVPSHVLESVIGPALASLGKQQVEERIRNSAGEMSPPLRGQFLQNLLNLATNSGLNLPGLLSQLGVRPTVIHQPETATPDEVAKVAAEVHETRPDVFNQAMRFYKDHPALVKVLGTLAIAKIAQGLSNNRKL